MPDTTTGPTVGQTIEQSIGKAGDAAQDAARDLGTAAGRAADSAMEQLAPLADHAERMGRDMAIAADTVRQGCAEGFANGWWAMWDGNFGTAFQYWGEATASCTDSVTASLMALFPGYF